MSNGILPVSVSQQQALSAKPDREEDIWAKLLLGLWSTGPEFDSRARIQEAGPRPILVRRAILVLHFEQLEAVRPFDDYPITAT